MHRSQGIPIATHSFFQKFYIVLPQYKERFKELGNSRQTVSTCETMEQMQRETTIREEKVLVLDFLPNGYPLDPRPTHKKTAIVQAVGKDHFTLLELVPKKGTTLKLMQELYIGPDKRDEIQHIVGRLPIHKLTGTAKQELEFVIKEIVHTNQTKFIEFLNKALPLSTRMHQLELLSGLGKKHMLEIIEARKD